MILVQHKTTREEIFMKYDAIIIGSGQAGIPLAVKLANTGLKTALIEKGPLGGTCVNTGCTPTKAYVASARRAYVTRNSADLGVSVEGKVHVDLKQIKARKDQMRREAHEGLGEHIDDTAHLTLISGKAQFVDNNTVEVNGEKLEGERIFINVGGRPYIPEGLRDISYLTNASILELEEIPAHLLIVGGSYIGLEFGQMFRRFGSAVTIVEMADRLVKREDTDISDAIKQIMENEGIRLRLNAECIDGKEENDQIVLDLDCKEDEKTVIGTHVLVATGRQPNTDDLGLEHTDITTDDRGFIEVNDQLATAVPGVYALGDCNGKGAFTHTSYNDYQIVADNLLDDAKRSVSDRIMCYGLFIDPPLGRVGMTAQQVKQAGIPANITTRPMSRVARAKEKGETQGLMKVITSQVTDGILGAAILGVGGDEAVHALIDLMTAQGTYQVIRDAVHIHPTVSELIPTMLESLEPLEE